MKAWHVVVAAIVAVAALIIGFVVRPYINVASTPPPSSNQSAEAGDLKQINQNLQALTEKQKEMEATVKQINSQPLKIDCNSFKSCFGSGHQPAPGKQHSSGNGSSHGSSSSSSNHTELTATLTCNGGPCNSGTGTPTPRAEEQPPRHEAQSNSGPITAERDNGVTAIITTTKIDY